MRDVHRRRACGAGQRAVGPPPLCSLPHLSHACVLGGWLCRRGSACWSCSTRAAAWNTFSGMEPTGGSSGRCRATAGCLRRRGWHADSCCLPLSCNLRQVGLVIGIKQSWAVSCTTRRERHRRQAGMQRGFLRVGRLLKAAFRACDALVELTCCTLVMLTRAVASQLLFCRTSWAPATTAIAITIVSDCTISEQACIL